MIDRLEPLILGDLEIKVPIIQGGMGVRVSTAPLVSAVANCGAGGTIASVGLPPDTEENRADVPKSSREHLIKEIRRSRELTKGVVGVNIMMALSNYEDIVRTTVQEKADYIISGAGIPISLPEYTKGSPIKLIPLISSARAAAIILKTWKRRYNRLPDAIIVEGPLSGGHIADFELEKLRSLGSELRKTPFLENAFKEVLELVRKYEQENNASIPVIAAGGIFDGKDVAKFIRMGAKGVQIGTRFVATLECSASEAFKELYVKSTEDDLVFIQSPVGLPAKVIRTKFIDKVLAGGGAKFNCVYQCLRTCDPSKVPYCIAKALINAVDGDIDNAVVLAGTNISKITKIISVKEMIDEIVSEAIEELNRLEKNAPVNQKTN